MEGLGKKSGGLMTLIGVGSDIGPASGKSKSEDYTDRKVTAAEEAIAAVADEDAEAFSDAITALVKLCKLERRKPMDGEDEEEE